MSDSNTMSKPSAFDAFELHGAILRGVQELGFTSPRPIQEATIPAILEGRDVLGLAQTGTGKTAAFALPILSQLMRERRKQTRALIVAPTRELATQIATEIRALAKYTKIKVAVVFGGVPVHKQRSILKGRPEIVVGCPGRILDLLGQKILHLKDVETLVLDEADHMFDMGFLPDVRRILNALPRDRQNLLFSATMPDEIRGLAGELLHDPETVELARSAPAETIDHALYYVTDRRKRELLDYMLGMDECDSAIVFTRTKHRARRLAEQLRKAGHKAVGLQGAMSQGQRDRAMKGFREGRFDIMVATDIVARGIDVSGVSHVINFDVPNTPEAYTHRIGRTGRAEREGVACTFVTGSDHGWVRATEKMIGSQIPRREVPGFTSPAAESNDDARHKGASKSTQPKRRWGGHKSNNRRRRRAS